ncbi:MAG TPA: phosphate signaling complex protein PhoU [Polyangiaceae bacterium]|nr:phosphate signaling complex protein PhoU [Polyangiaceae bacterium]
MNHLPPERPKHLYSKLDTDLRALKDGVVKMGSAVDAQVARALDAFVKRDSTAAAAVVTGDKQVNTLERELDEHCVLVLALLQPAASDLRFVAAVLKIVTDLERIGDFAVSIAKAVAGLDPLRLRAEQDLVPLGEAAVRILRNSLDAFVRRDVAEAQEACTADQPVTAALVALGKELRNEMSQRPEALDNALATLLVTKYLERIAEHATNIAEMALYTERGEDIRHIVERPA